MNVALIIAGGIGSRTGFKIPKQFILIEDKPIIIYTLEVFEKHQEIDLICVACLDGWENQLREYAEKFGISKLKIIIQGGPTGFQSIRNGLYALKAICQYNDIVIIHDAIRPLVSQEIITDNLNVCKQYGNAISFIPSTEALLQCDQGSIKTSNSINRDLVLRTQTPQSCLFGKIIHLHEEADRRGIQDSVALSTLLTSLGHDCFTSLGGSDNIKITTSEDLELFRAMLKARLSFFDTYRQLCVKGNQKLFDHNLVILTWGNYSLRIPQTDLICIKPSGVPYLDLTPDKIPIVRLDGVIIEGKYKPSVDLETHLEIYRKNPSITNIVHTHSTYATSFAQALCPIPVLGTTHADFCNTEIPLSRELTQKEIEKNYEFYSGVAINELLEKRDAKNTPAVLLPYHAPFVFGYKTLDACEHAIILEEIAKIAHLTQKFDLHNKKTMPASLIQRAWERKNGKNPYYGQLQVKNS